MTARDAEGSGTPEERLPEREGNMKLNVSKAWCLEMALREGEAEVGAGGRHDYLIHETMTALLRCPLCAEQVLASVRAAPAEEEPISTELRIDLERHAAWLQGLNLGIGKELATWLVERPHYAALWKAQVDENARLRAAVDGLRGAAPSDHEVFLQEPVQAAFRALYAGVTRGGMYEREIDLLRAVRAALNRVGDERTASQ
jgi:hypothetical protein